MGTAVEEDLKVKKKDWAKEYVVKWRENKAKQYLGGRGFMIDEYAEMWRLKTVVFGSGSVFAPKWITGKGIQDMKDKHTLKIYEMIQTIERHSINRICINDWCYYLCYIQKVRCLGLSCEAGNKNRGLMKSLLHNS